MKIIAIGDTHGTEHWKKVVNQPFDHLVFIGDYFDTHEKITPYKQLEVFLDILQFKQDNPAKVHMIWGNHDYHYKKGVTDTYSGYQGAMQYTFRDALEKAEPFMDTHWVHENLLFVHAGITNTWMSDWGLSSVDEIPELFKTKDKSFGFISRQRGNAYGDNTYQSPLWVRPLSLKADGLKGYDQVVGHTRGEKLKIEQSNGQTYYFIDCLGTSGEYLVFNDLNPEIRRVTE